MIGKLRGIVDAVDNDTLIVDVGGVGYVVFISASTRADLPGRGEAVLLYIETHVREDHIHLYGFASKAEQDAFRLLNRVSGVGAKMALAVLSALTPEALVTAIMAEDKAAFRRAPGVGPKLASRIITELKDRVAGGWVSEASAPVVSSSAGKSANNSVADAVSALVNLGYSRSDAFMAVNRIPQKEERGVDALIKEGLKSLANV